jgi:hypothetical protein
VIRGRSICDRLKIRGDVELEDLIMDAGDVEAFSQRPLAKLGREIDSCEDPEDPLVAMLGKNCRERTSNSFIWAIDSSRA